MTDLLIRDPNDTGDIPAVGEKTVRIDAVGEGTRNLAPYVAGLPPAMRRPTASLPVIAGCRRIDWDDPEFQPPGQPQPPKPLPTPPPPKPSAEVLWDYADPSDAYTGRHRRPSRWDWLTVPLSAGLQIIRAAWAKDGNR